MFDTPPDRSAGRRPLACALTMVRDDLEFLRRWLDHYGAQFGRGHLYVINHGGGSAVAEMAAGCNVIALPAGGSRRFDTRRWRLLNGMIVGLLGYYRHVIVGDVDELVVVDPGIAPDLNAFLRDLRGKRVLTPLGLEVVHRAEDPRAPLEPGPLLQQRRHVIVAPRYAKPCILGAPARLSRGGHYASADRLHMPRGLYLLHLRACDRALFADTLDRRNRMVAASRADRPGQAMVAQRWFPKARDDATFWSDIDARPMAGGFDMAPVRRALADGWTARPGTPFWQLGRVDDRAVYRLPDRFADLV